MGDKIIGRLLVVESKGLMGDCVKCVFRDLCDITGKTPCDIDNWNCCYFTYDNGDKESENNE